MSNADHTSMTWDCLRELETEYLRVGAEHCQFLEIPTQLTAFFLSGVRSVSLLRGMFRSLEPDFLDAYDTIRRAFVEAWQLQYYFRLKKAAGDAQKWLQGAASSWKPDFKALEESNRALGLDVGKFGREFFMLCEVAHPTVVAAKNSCALASILRAF